MRGEPNIATIAALIGDPARAAILTALTDGRALPAGELAVSAGLSPSAASAHLAKLLEGGLLLLEREGRHRYYRLAGPGVAAALESLAVISVQPSCVAVARPPQAQALRYARSCYDHLAGELGVAIALALEDRGADRADRAGQGRRCHPSRCGMAGSRVGHRFAPAEVRTPWPGNASVSTGQSVVITWQGRSALDCFNVTLNLDGCGGLPSPVRCSSPGEATTACRRCSGSAFEHRSRRRRFHRAQAGRPAAAAAGICGAGRTTLIQSGTAAKFP
jgi:DNA-binding transcriptional ArsR family regulator